MKNISSEVKITKALAYASGTADREGAGLDMQGFEEVAMVVQCAAVADAATLSIKAQQSSDDAVADAYSDLEGTSQTIAGTDDDQIFVIFLVKPQKRYVRLYVDKDAANTCAESAIYLQSGARELPVDNNVADTITSEQHVAVAEGTA